MNGDSVTAVCALQTFAHCTVAHSLHSAVDGLSHGPWPLLGSMQPWMPVAHSPHVRPSRSPLVPLWFPSGTSAPSSFNGVLLGGNCYCLSETTPECADSQSKCRVLPLRTHSAIAHCPSASLPECFHFRIFPIAATSSST